MSTSRRTYDTDQINLRDIYAYGPNDAFISSGRYLAALGNGKAEWVIPSTIYANPSFNQVIANGTQLIADASYNTLTLSTLDGLGITTDVPEKKVYFFNKAFTQFDISGAQSLLGYKNNTVTPTVKFIGKSGINITTDPLTNTLTFQGIPTAISTGVYAYNKINVISNSPVLNLNTKSTFLTATSPTSILGVIGLGDIILSTNTTSNTFTIGISTFTSLEYQQISTLANSNVSTVSTLFYDRPQVGQATSSLLDFTSNVSVGIYNRINYDATYFTNFYTPINLFQNLSTSTKNITDSKINFTSSFGFPELGIIQLGVNDAGSLLFSSATFHLSTLSSFIQSNAKIEIRESLGMIFNANTPPLDSVLTVSTFLTANDAFLPSTLFTRPWIAPNGSSSNLYTDTIFMSLDPLTANETLPSTFKIVHRINTTTFSDFNVLNATSEKNGVSIRIWN